MRCNNYPLKQIKDNRGKCTWWKWPSVFKTFGEIYFSAIYQVLKHGICIKKQRNYVCVEGKVELALFDDRNKSTTKGRYQKIMLSLITFVTIPPLIWNGFKGIYEDESNNNKLFESTYDETEMVEKIHKMSILIMSGLNSESCNSLWELDLDLQKSKLI